MSGAIPAHAAADWKQQLEKASDEYFDQVYFRYAPSSGTLAGFHQYDTQLENYSRPAIDAQISPRSKSSSGALKPSSRTTLRRISCRAATARSCSPTSTRSC